MNISSSRFDLQDQVFFNENFKIKDKSPGVSSLDEADVIFLGDDHTVINHKTKNLWLIHKLARKGDTVFKESGVERNCDPLDSYLPSRVYAHGWDSLEIRKQMDTRQAMVCKGLSILEQITSSNAGMKEKKEAIQAANALIPLNSVVALEEKIKHLKKPTSYYSPLAQREICNNIAEKAKAAQTAEELESYFTDFVPSITDFWIRFIVYSDSLGSITRNVSLGQNTSFEARGKVFATAGKTHLRRPKNPQLGDEEAVEELKKILGENNKKYVVLFPKGNGTVDHAKKFLKQQKPGIFTRIFHLFKVNILLSVSIFLLSTAAHFPNEKIYILSVGLCMCALHCIRLLYHWYNMPTGSYKTMFSIADRRSALISKITKSEDPKKKEEEYWISEKKLQEEISISEGTISKIQTCMKNVLQCKEEGGVKLYKSAQDHRVFALDVAPELIFKMKASKNRRIVDTDDSMKARYQRMVNAQTVVRTHQLRLLVIPNAKLFTVDADGEEYEIIAEKKIDINPYESSQEQYFQDYAESLTETIRQLAVFICKTGYSDVEWRNIPIIKNSLDGNGNRKVALIDIEEMDRPDIGLFGGGWGGRRGLVKCVNEEQGKIVESIARQNGINTSSSENTRAQRKEELEDDSKLKEYYAQKNILTGDELIQIDENALDFSMYPTQAEKLKALTIDLIKAINEKTSKSSPEESVKGRRYVQISTRFGPFKGMDELINPDEDASKTEEEYYNATFLGHIVKKLADLGVIYKLIQRNYYGYSIQA